jgi:hypothetical protein
LVRNRGCAFLRENFGLALKASHTARIAGESIGENLQRHVFRPHSLPNYPAPFFQYVVTVLVPRVVDAYDFDPELHANLRDSSSLANRWLASFRLNRSGSSRPDCSKR